MEANIQQLIDKEKEAEERIQAAVHDKEEAKRRAIHDAELALSIIQSEHDKKIKKIQEDSEIYLESLRKELNEEHEMYAGIFNSKDIAVAVSEISKIVSGEQRDLSN
ncbi:uncharacterized protein VICG_01362 [Vittaforma corneae ATCC 50505]|uniref:Uncharacterized protein n=1 Tax=Vittaforma corneae (strain ATCC 50505) TaxID=993615 RepID=L2GLX3_VITCO|nr:uncharacterized protein VICG_01362 [Vittaforma corneae ATCC 50505]ELA41614.1 hypothetical protein VICG_01362 [Vittaforma corneae ATCC 50505]